MNQTRCRVRMFVTDDDPGIVCTLPHDHLGSHIVAPMRYVKPELLRSTADKPEGKKP